MADYRVEPFGLLNFGLTPDGSVVDGVGLMTNGFVFSCYSPFVPGISMVMSTGWTTVFGTSSTLWTGATGAMYGPC